MANSLGKRKGRILKTSQIPSQIACQMPGAMLSNQPAAEKGPKSTRLNGVLKSFAA